MGTIGQKALAPDRDLGGLCELSGRDQLKRIFALSNFKVVGTGALRFESREWVECGRCCHVQKT